MLICNPVKVPHHAALVRAALAAKKHVFCEWPLGNGLAEARELAALAKESDVLCVVGTQAPFAPEVIHLRRLIAEGFVGKVLSTTLTGQPTRKEGRGGGKGTMCVDEETRWVCRRVPQSRSLYACLCVSVRLHFVSSV